MKNPAENVPMDIKESAIREVRRRRLQDKIRAESASATRPDGNVSAFGAKYGIGQSRLSRYATAGNGMQVKHIGYDAARSLERDLRMPSGELDSLDGEYGEIYATHVQAAMAAAQAPAPTAPPAAPVSDIPDALSALATRIRPERRDAVAALIQGVLAQPLNPAFVKLLREELDRN